MQNRLWFSRGKPLSTRTANGAENCLVFGVVRVYICVYTEREREPKRNLVRAENRVDCFRSEILGGVRDGFCVQPISGFNLGYVAMYKVHHSTDTLTDK